MRMRTIKGAVFALGVLLFGSVFSHSANAGSLRQGSTGSSGAVTGSLPGQVLWTYYQTQLDFAQICPPDGLTEELLCNTGSIGDNIIRLINPNGAANGNLAGAREQQVCAMIYVFDDDEEMGECCGCPLTSAQLATFSVEQNLTSDWGLAGGDEGGIPDNPKNGNGSIAIVAAAPNTIGCLGAGGGSACHGGCDPTNVPGYSVTVTSNLLGSITHNQAVIRPTDVPITDNSVIFGINETPLSDDAGGDPTNLVYLQSQCGALIGNGTQGGICNCPIE